MRSSLVTQYQLCPLPLSFFLDLDLDIRSKVFTSLLWSLDFVLVNCILEIVNRTVYFFLISGFPRCYRAALSMPCSLYLSFPAVLAITDRKSVV